MSFKVYSSLEIGEIPLLSGKEFDHHIFKKESWISQDLKHRIFSHCLFEGCDFTQSLLTGSKFVDCKMLKCNLSLTRWEGCRLQGVEFQDCKLSGVNFGKCDPMFLSLKFSHCLIDACNYSDLDLKGTYFTQCIIRETHFTNAGLSEANFSGSDLAGTLFHNSNLTKVNFVGAINYAINPLTNGLKGARFSQPEVLALLTHLGIVIEK